MKKFFITFCVALLPVLMMAKSSSDVPAWISSAQSQGYWIGISHPTINRAEARQMAIANSLLYYIVSEGGAECVMMLDENIEDNDDISSQRLKYEEKSLLDGISFEIADEYYNSNGECFIAGKIAKSPVSNAAVKISKKAELNNDRANYNIIMNIKCQYGTFDIDVTKDFENNVVENVSYKINQSKIDCDNSISCKKDIDFSKEKSEQILFSSKQNKSLGLTMFDLLTEYPTVCDSIKIASQAYSSLNDSHSEYRLCLKGLGYGTSIPNKLILTNMKKGKLKYFLGIEYRRFDPDYISTHNSFAGIEPMFLSETATLCNALDYLNYEVNEPKSENFPSVFTIVGRGNEYVKDKKECVLYKNFDVMFDGKPYTVRIYSNTGTYKK